MAEQTQYTVDSQLKDETLTNTIKKERGKLLTFISNRTPTIEDAEDILQDVFYELVQSDAIENTAAWLYRVARNKITDWYRKMKPSRLDDITINHYMIVKSFKPSFYQHLLHHFTNIRYMILQSIIT